MTLFFKDFEITEADIHKSSVWYSPYIEFGLSSGARFRMSLHSFWFGKLFHAQLNDGREIYLCPHCEFAALKGNSCDAFSSEKMNLYEALKKHPRVKVKSIFI